MGPLINLYEFYFMNSSALCIVMYGMIKSFAVRIYATALDSHNSHTEYIAHRNLSLYSIIYTFQIAIGNPKFALVM